MTATRPILICLLMLPSAAIAAEVTLTTIEGATHTGELVSLDAAGAAVRAAGKTTTVAKADLQSVRRRRDPKAKSGGRRPPPPVTGQTRQGVLRTADGGIVPFTVATLEAGKLKAYSVLFGPLTLDVSHAASLAWTKRGPVSPELPEEIAALNLEGLTGDVLVASSDEAGLVPVAGVLKAIGPEKITFNYGGEDRTIDAAKVQYIRLAATAAKSAPARGVLVGIGGARVPFAAATLNHGDVRIQSLSLGTVAAPLEKVSELRYHSERVTYLSDLKPAAVCQSGSLGEAVFVYRTDQSALRKPLRLDGRTYARGLGMHSRCELTYQLDGAYVTFVAIAGIDDAARPRGHAILSISTDLKSRADTFTLTGADKARLIRLDVRGANQLTILVDFGADLDIGDHVDLAEARLIKAEAATQPK